MSRLPSESRYVVSPRGSRGGRTGQHHPLDDTGWARAWIDFREREPGNARDYLAGLDGRLERSSGTLVAEPSMPLVFLPQVPGREVVEVLGLVTATSVKSRNMFSDLGSDTVVERPAD